MPSIREFKKYILLISAVFFCFSGSALCVCAQQTLPPELSRSEDEMQQSEGFERLTEGDYTYVVDGESDEAMLVEYSGTVGKQLHIPEKIGGKDVTALAYEVYANSPELETVFLPEKLDAEGFGSHAFFGCGNLSEFVLGDNKNFKTVDGVLYTQDMTALEKYPPALPAESFTVPDTVDFIDFSAFSDAKNLKSVILPDKLEVIGERAFYGAENLTGISFPQSLKHIQEWAFANTALETVNITAGLERLDGYIFSFCDTLTDITFEPGARPKLTAYVFAGCLQITEMTVPEGIGVIPAFAFARCEKLSEITLPETMYEISEYAFIGTGLKEAVIPVNVAKIGEKAFGYGYAAENVPEVNKKFVMKGIKFGIAQIYAESNSIKFRATNGLPWWGWCLVAIGAAAIGYGYFVLRKTPADKRGRKTPADKRGRRSPAGKRRGAPAGKRDKRSKE
jgi:hypothetical protein